MRLTVVGSDIYIAGAENNDSGLGVAKLWSRVAGANVFTATDVSDGLRNAVANVPVVVGGDVYVAGIESNSSHKGAATLWSRAAGAKDFTATVLSKDQSNAKAFFLAVENGDVHVVGVEEDSNGNGYARYWRNGQIDTSLSTVSSFLAVAVGQ